jgi:(p)ppGpp synthase/HD superfamily hydrolase
MPDSPNAPTLQDAIRLALDAHRGQKDRYGAAYILHPLRMMNRLTAEPDRITAVLHDVVEDSTTTLDDLRKLGFGEEIVTAVDCLTRRSGEHYEAYVERCKGNAIARRVKVADLEDNLDLRRLDEINAQDLERLNRYLKAWHYLNESG